MLPIAELDEVIGSVIVVSSTPVVGDLRKSK
jgi:hypothetical protein